jgi:hypothetical protein
VRGELGETLRIETLLTQYLRVARMIAARAGEIQGVVAPGGRRARRVVPSGKELRNLSKTVQAWAESD